jgi:hypothetical protein
MSIIESSHDNSNFTDLTSGYEKAGVEDAENRTQYALEPKVKKVETE